MQGTGNSFVFGDLRSPKNKALFKKEFGKLSRKKLARMVCNMSTGIGADGFALFENTGPGAAVRWDFYNSDGSKAEMCGNAARCAGIYLSKGKALKKPFQLRTRAGLLEIKVNSIDKVQVEMTPIRYFERNQSITINGKKIAYAFVNSGVPHVVIQVKNLELSDKYRVLAKLIQAHHRFMPKSTNVTFYEKTGPRNIATASFERGVFDFTKACGTGAVAAAAVFSDKSSAQIKKIKLRVPGGVLNVDLAGVKPILTGPAKHIADFKIYL